MNITIHDEIIRAPKPLSSYGDDGQYGRDYGDGTEFLPAILAKHVVESIDEATLSDYDLNEDGVVDRFLILHSTLAQEQGSGSSNRIWSHFTSFSEPSKTEMFRLNTIRCRPCDMESMDLERFCTK